MAGYVMSMNILAPLVCRFTYRFTCRRHGGTKAGLPTGGGTEAGGMKY